MLIQMQIISTITWFQLGLCAIWRNGSSSCFRFSQGCTRLHCLYLTFFLSHIISPIYCQVTTLTKQNIKLIFGFFIKFSQIFYFEQYFFKKEFIIKLYYV